MKKNNLIINSLELINFTDLNFEEKEMVLSWRNNLDIRKWMYNQNEIKLDEHLNFIESLKGRENKLYFLVKKENEFIGVLYFTNFDSKEVFYGIYSNPNSKILGIGRILDKISIDYAFDILKVKRLKLEVFEDNIQVINLHKKYGFKESGEKIINSRKVICMELEKA